MHLGPFGCIMKLGRKRAELVQKFMPRSRVGIFRNEGTRNTPLDPKLMFFCILYCLRAFGTVWLPYETRFQNGPNLCKSSCHEVLSEFFAMNASDPPHWILNSCFRAFLSVWVHLGLFRYCMKLGVKWAEYGPNIARVHATKSLRNFSEQLHRSTP